MAKRIYKVMLVVAVKDEDALRHAAEKAASSYIGPDGHSMTSEQYRQLRSKENDPIDLDVDMALGVMPTPCLEKGLELLTQTTKKISEHEALIED